MDGDIEESMAKTRDVYRRACTIHLTKKPNIMLNWSAFEESHNNIDKARGILNTHGRKRAWFDNGYFEASWA